MKMGYYILVVLVVILAMTAGVLAQGLVGPSSYAHTTDGLWTDWTPGTTAPYEWFDIRFARGRYSYYSADYIPTDATLYVMNDFFGNVQDLNSSQYNSFTVTVPGAAVTDVYEIRVYGDNTVQALKNGDPEANVGGAFQFTASPFFPDTNHTVYEIDLPVTPANVGNPFGMGVKDPIGPGPQGGAFVGTITPLAGGGVEIQRVVTPIGFSVDGGQYNGLRNGVTGPAANPAEGLDPSYLSPDDVYSLGSAGGHNLATEGEIFQSPVNSLFGIPDGTNADRISGALGVGVGPYAPPPAGPPTVTPPGALGLVPNDNINALSYGKDGGNTLHFSVDPCAVGQVGTGVNFQAVISPIGGLLPGAFPANPGGGDPGDEAAGDIFVTGAPVFLLPFGLYPTFTPAGGGIQQNSLELDETFLGLQAPALTGSFLGAPEDDLDALEMSDAHNPFWGVDVDANGLVDDAPTRNLFFSLDSWSPTVTGSGGTVAASDILVTRDGTRTFSVYADGVNDIGLLAGDNLDALVLSDAVTFGVLDPMPDEALFSLAPESPTLWGPDGAPGVVGFDDDGVNGVDDLGEVGLGDDLSPGDVFRTNFSGSFWLYAASGTLGLLPTDNLNALDISFPWIHHTVDHFNSYAAHEDLRAVWHDYWTGGINAEVFVEKTFVRDGNSMKYDYDNYVGGGGVKNRYSEAWANAAALEIGQDWTVGGARAMVLYFYGDPCNAADPVKDRMYVVLEDTDANIGMLKYPDMNDIQEASWQEWNIDLQDPCLSAVDTNNVTKVYIGFGVRGGSGAGQDGGEGTVYFDDIRLYPPRCRSEISLPYGDITGECLVDYADVNALAGDWLVSDPNSKAELIHDGIVNFRDYRIMADNWLKEFLWPPQP